MSRHFDEFKEKLSKTVGPLRNNPHITVKEYLFWHDELARIAIQYGFPHRPQLISIAGGNYPAMIDPDGRSPSFVIE